MPIKVKDAKKYQGYEADEMKIARFLNEHPEDAYTLDEIMKGIGEAPLTYTKDEKGSYWTWQNAGSLVANMANRMLIKDTLDRMVKTGKIQATVSGGTIYYFMGGDVLF